MMLERLCCSDAAFVTLTYSDDTLAYSEMGYPTLCKRDLQLFLKRLRKSLGRKFRYYACGEYGENTERPHYHLALFGLSPVVDADRISRSWFFTPDTPFGIVHIGEVTNESAQYVAGYVTKKITHISPALRKQRRIERTAYGHYKTKLYDEKGRLPEFSIMSLKPGIGYPALDQIERIVNDDRFRKYFDLQGDVPNGLMHGKKFYPFGRYLKSKLREMMDIEVDPVIFIKEMREAYDAASKGEQTLTEYLLHQDEAKANKQKYMQRIFNKRGQI